MTTINLSHPLVHNVNQDRIHKDMNLQYCNYTLVVLFVPFNETNQKKQLSEEPMYIYISIGRRFFNKRFLGVILYCDYTLVI